MSANLKNFDAYPFPTIALNKDRLIIYRNYVAEKLYPQIHMRASIKMYSDVKSCEGFTTNSFFASKTSIFSHVADEFQILIILPFNSFKDMFEKDYKSIIASVLYSNNTEELTQKSRATLRQIVKSYRKAVAVNLFTDLFIGDDNVILNEKINLVPLFKTILKAFSFKTDFQLDFEQTDENIVLIGNRRRLLLSIISCVNFAYLNSKTTSAKVTLRNTDDKAHICFEFLFNENKEKYLSVLKSIFQKDVPLTTLILGLCKSENSNVEASISEKNNLCTIELSIPIAKAGEYIFSDSQSNACDIEKIIDFYISTNQ